ncbi:MAG: BamA/TamA family outer membrane protein [Planctomycetales bacterium]|nr:BamA/TamA family outer membrane protein [Planctomycetales bacterium]
MLRQPLGAGTALTMLFPNNHFGVSLLMHFLVHSQRRLGSSTCVLARLAVVAVVAVSFARCVSAAESLPPPAGATTPTADQVIEIRIVGNDTIPTSKVSGHLSTRVGRPFDTSIVQRDVRQLANLGWFVDVKPLYESTPQGQIVIFQVVERPTIRYVTYLGNEGISDKKLGKETGLKAGGAVDPYAVEEGRRKIREHYQGRGYNNVQVTILEGTRPTDQGIVYLINEGNSQKIWNVSFVGNEFVSDGRLKTLIKSKPPVLKLFKGYVNREQIDSDVDQLTAYYRSFGYFQAKVSRKLDYNESGKWVDLTFVISEGPRYEVRSVKFLGNTKFEPAALASSAKLSAGQPFEQSKVRDDALWLQELYGSHGYVFADIRPEPVFLEEPGQLDLIYHLEEGEQFRVGRIFVHIGGDNPHTRVQTALNRMTLRPGDIMDIRELKASERRLLASSLFHSDVSTNTRPKITYRIPDGTEPSFANQPRERTASNRGSAPSPPGSSIRGQSPEPAGPYVLPPPLPSTAAVHSVSRPASDRSMDIHIECDDWQHFQRWQNGVTVAPSEPSSLQAPGSTPSPAAEPEQSGLIIRGQSPEAQPSANSAWWAPRATRSPYQSIRGQSPTGYTNSAYSSLPAGGTPYGGQAVGATGPATKPLVASSGVQQAQYTDSIPPPAGSFGPPPGLIGNPVPGYQLFPDGHFGLPGQPYPQQTVDIFFEGEETQTGRLMIGAGINSDAGVVGNITLDERNFDWRRPPRSWEDVRNGTAFRGAGQRFRIDASPGSQVNRYLMSFQEPYLLDTPISLGLSASFFDRRFRDWDEQRLGGRVSLGYQWVEHDLSANVAYRGESINVRNPSLPTQPDLADALGSNALHGFKLTVVNDTRDSAFLPTEGHYLELSGEQVIGTFDYPRVAADYRRYFLLSERPDHSGRHVLSASANVAYSGTQTPIYEHFFAGGYSTLRGFDFRGASPVDMGVEVGGEFQWLNSVQYLFPITADDMLHGVVFCDFGTVEKDVTIKDFRVAPGAGLRVTVPAMGPAPIALDFAWAVNYADTDDREVFSFSLGFTR